MMKTITTALAAVAGISSGVVLVVLVVGGGPVDGDEAGDEAEQSRQGVEAAFADAQRSLVSSGEGSRSWGVCMSSPTDAVTFGISSQVDGDPDTTLESVTSRLQAGGWTVESENDEAGLRSVVMIKDGDDLSLGTNDRGVSLGLTGECIRVPSDLAEDLLAE